MSMSRSRFGRHTQKNDSMYPSNTTESLTKLMESVRQEIFQINHTTNIEFLNYLNAIILDFYERSQKLLTKNQKSPNQESNNFATVSKARSHNNLLQTSPTSSQSSISSSLSEISSLITSNSTRSSFERINNTENSNIIYSETSSIKLPECVLVFFCVLFEINIHFMNGRLSRVKRNYENFLKSKIDLILKKNKFVELLKIGLFIKSIDSLLDKNNNNFCYDSKNQLQQQHIQASDSFDKRLTDLMRSEFALFRFEANSNSTDFQSYLGLLCSGLDQILIQNMTIREMEIFFINKFK